MLDQFKDYSEISEISIVSFYEIEDWLIKGDFPLDSKPIKAKGFVNSESYYDEHISGFLHKVALVFKHPLPLGYIKGIESLKEGCCWVLEAIHEDGSPIVLGAALSDHGGMHMTHVPMRVTGVESFDSKFTILHLECISMQRLYRNTLAHMKDSFWKLPF